MGHISFLARLCYKASVRLSVHLSVTEVHWRIIANLDFKFRSHFTAHCAMLLAAAVLLAGGSSRAMLASARLSYYLLLKSAYFDIQCIHAYTIKSACSKTITYTFISSCTWSVKKVTCICSNLRRISEAAAHNSLTLS